MVPGKYTVERILSPADKKMFIDFERKLKFLTPLPCNKV